MAALAASSIADTPTATALLITRGILTYLRSSYRYGPLLGQFLSPRKTTYNPESEDQVGEKSVEFQTSLSVQECGMRFKSAIENGRGTSAWIGGITAKLIGGETLSWYTPPDDDSPFAALDDDPPTFSVGVSVPKAQGAHANGTNVHMLIWDRGSHRDVVLWAHHSLTGGSHASKLLQAARSQVEA